MSAPALPSTQAAIDEALSASRPQDVIDGVKAAVYRELAELDPAAKIEDTRYFNHTFVPDFVMTWNDAGRKSHRDIYLRPSLASTIAGRDLQALGSNAPVLLSLRSSRIVELDDGLEGEARREVVEHAPNALVTGVAALDEFTGDADADEPLQALVRPNLVRGGRGLISRDTLASLHVPLTGDDDDAPRLAAFGELVRQVFVPAAATRLERAAQILEVGLTGDISGLLPNLDSAEDELLRGRLSDAEVDVLLPYLLSRAGVTRQPAFWAHVGSMLDLARLESMGTLLQGLDLTPLLAANSSVWTATRAALALNAEDGDTAQDGSWRLAGKTIAKIQGPWRIHITSDGKKLRGRDDSLAARWDELAPVLQGRPVAAVALHGVQRRVNVIADQAADVLADVNTIRQSISDDFFVPAITVRSSQEEDASRVELDFKRMLAMASAPTPVDAMVELTVSVLGHRLPDESNELEESPSEEHSSADGGKDEGVEA